MQSTLERDAGFTLATWQHRPESFGYVRAKNTDPFHNPEIQPTIFKQTLTKSYSRGNKNLPGLTQTNALKPYFVEETYPGMHCVSNDELLNSAREIGQSIYHLMGTCQMGPKTNRMSVVDHQLKVHGIRTYVL